MARRDLRASHPERVAADGSDAISVHGVRPTEIPETLNGHLTNGIAGCAGELELSCNAESVGDGELGHSARVVVSPASSLETGVPRDNKAAGIQAPRVRRATRAAVEP